jgi:hypothetical protein
MSLNRFGIPPPASLANLVRTSAAVRERFQRLLSRLEYTGPDLAKFELHRISVTRRLHTAFSANRILPIGSAQRQTAIPQSSDLDLMLVLQTKEVYWGRDIMRSSTVLDNVRTELRYRYKNTEIGRDGQAVVVDFEDGERPIDVVPGVFVGLKNGVATYLIPDGSGDWIQTSPDAHNKLISIADARSGGKLKYIAKLLKYWRGCRIPEIPLRSFHIELLLAYSGTCLGAKTHGQCLFELLKLLSERQCRALQDPCGISGLIPAATTEAKRQRAAATVADSLGHAARALTAEATGRTPDALSQWDLVFNGLFPA